MFNHHHTFWERFNHVVIKNEYLRGSLGPLQTLLSLGPDFSFKLWGRKFVQDSTFTLQREWLTSHIPFVRSPRPLLRLWWQMQEGHCPPLRMRCLGLLRASACVRAVCVCTCVVKLGLRQWWRMEAA